MYFPFLPSFLFTNTIYNMINTSPFKLKFGLFFFAAMTLFLVQCSSGEQALEEQITPNTTLERLDIKLATEGSLENIDTDKKSNQSRTLNTINAAIKCSGFSSILFSGNKTIFAPTDEAFNDIGLNATNICDKLDSKSLLDILNYHVNDSHIERYDRGCMKMLDGGTAFLNTVKRFKTAINNNEVKTIYNQRKSYYDLNVFMTDAVLEVPAGNVLETIQEDKDLSYLADIIALFPELANVLSDETSFVSIFAPTDRSIQELLIRTGSRNAETLLENVGADALQQIISYHIVDDCVYISGLSEKQSLQSIQGASLSYNQFQNGVIDETNKVIRFERNAQDILGSNGIIHKIKGVMSPEIERSNAGLNVRKTNAGVDDVKASIINAFSGIAAIGVAAEISHSTNAASVGRTLNPTELILFGNPKLGTPIMQANQQAGIDLPQKYLIYEDAEGQTRIAYNDISYITARHGLSDDIPTLAIMTNALNNFASAQSDRARGPITNLPEKGEGLIDKISQNTFSDTYIAIVNAITNNPNLRVILELDHQANGARVGLDLRPTSLIVFGNPNLGTPLMQESQSVAIDLPQKFLVWEDELGAVHISYNDPFYLQSRHDIKNSDGILNTVAGALNALSNVGAGL